MNNKGFTLIELLLTIVVLGIIIAIAVPSYNMITEVIEENQRENIISKIEIAASQYAFDSGETIVFVDKLITEGYMSIDDEDGNIIDPINNTRMNCYIVEMEKTSDYYDATFIDGKNYDNNGVCDLNKLQENSENVSIQILNNSEIVVDSSSWLSGNIVINAYSNTLNIDCVTNKCVWTSSSGANVTGKDSITLNNIKGLLETKYIFQYTVYDNNSSEVKRYNASVNLKIDNESPIIYENQIIVTNKFIYTDYKNVTIVASDGNGSGINGYYIGKNISTCLSNDIVFQEANKIKITENGDYLICVKDSAGNISSKSLNIKYISS